MTEADLITHAETELAGMTLREMREHVRKRQDDLHALLTMPAAERPKNWRQRCAQAERVRDWWARFLEHGIERQWALTRDYSAVKPITLHELLTRKRPAQ